VQQDFALAKRFPLSALLLPRVDPHFQAIVVHSIAGYYLSVAFNPELLPDHVASHLARIECDFYVHSHFRLSGQAARVLREGVSRERQGPALHNRVEIACGDVIMCTAASCRQAASLAKRQPPPEFLLHTTTATLAWSTNVNAGTVLKYGTNPKKLTQTAEAP
jgi:hypothetical protein